MELIKYLDWDSSFFGFNIGRINIDSGQLRPKTLDEAIAKACACNVKCLYLEIPFSDPEVLAYCSEKGFLLVDFKTTLNKILINREEGGVRHSNITYELKDEYYSFLKKIVEQISRKSRYAYDPGFGQERSFQLYEEWLKKSFCKKYCDDFIVCIKDQKPVGFLTLKNKNGQAFIDLLGVLNNYRRKGIGGSLIKEAERKLLKAEHKTVKVVTQGHNISALRTYQNENFKIEAINIFYHKWID